MVAETSCRLAKHRRSDTIDRKDVQLASGELLQEYFPFKADRPFPEMTGSRAIPGFSSDLIRADQARSTKRAQSLPNPARATKLKAVEASRAAFRKDKAEVRERAGSGQTTSASQAQSRPQLNGIHESDEENSDPSERTLVNGVPGRKDVDGLGKNLGMNGIGDAHRPVHIIA